MSPRLVMRRLQSNCPAQWTKQCYSIEPELRVKTSLSNLVYTYIIAKYLITGLQCRLFIIITSMKVRIRSWHLNVNFRIWRPMLATASFLKNCAHRYFNNKGDIKVKVKKGLRTVLFLFNVIHLRFAKIFETWCYLLIFVLRICVQLNKILRTAQASHSTDWEHCIALY